MRSPHSSLRLSQRNSEPQAVSVRITLIEISFISILITGGTEGIGFAIVKAFAGAGASDIIIVARRPELLEEAKKGIEQAHPSTKVHTFPASIDDAEKAKSIFAQVREKIAEPDVVVFNAASGHAPTPTLELPVDKLWQDFEVNVGGHMNFLREYLRPTTSSKERIIINVSTLAAHAPVQGMASYGASKEAFVHLLSHVQLEYADKNVRIVSYHPGGIITSSAKRLGFDKYPIPWDNGM